MRETTEDSAPWSRLQKQALFGLPMSLGFALLMSREAIFGEYGLPRWAGLGIAAACVAALLGMIVVPRRSEASDERDRLIMLKATRRAFAFLLVMVLLPGVLRDLVAAGPPPWDAQGLARGTAMLALAVYFASVLLFYRSPAQD
jgi:peptidoglycan/LPS O-acetylase OafA/YrhL